MHIQRRNPPGRSDTADSDRLLAREDMDPDKKAVDKDLEGDPIISELRKLYEGVVDEPLPEDLLDLLKKLDEVERSR